MSAAKAQVTPTTSTALPRIVQRSATSRKAHRRFWRQVLRVFKSYFASPPNDMNLETWRRLEYRNEYAPAEPARLNFQRFI